MSPRSLFQIVLKILGIFFIKEMMVTVPTLLSTLLYLQSSQSTEAMWILFSSLAILGCYSLVIVYLVFKTDWVIDKFALDKGFGEETLTINIHRSTVLYLVLVLAGLFILVDAIPYFCRGLQSYFQEKRLTQGMTNPDLSYVIFYFAEIVAGILLMIYARFLTNFIELRRRKNSL